MRKSKPAARLFVLLARAAPVGIILRRGPSKQVLMIRWDTSSDHFEQGQWFKGRIYERRCDLSPSGEKLIYFAASFKPPCYSWTAISKPPYFTALALWPKGDCWNGGGIFLNEKKILLNHPSHQTALQSGTYLKGVRVAETAEYRGEDSTVYDKVRVRDGWKLIQEGNSTYLKSRSRWKIDPPQVYRKRRSARDFALEMSLRQVSGKRRTMV